MALGTGRLSTRTTGSRTLWSWQDNPLLNSFREMSVSGFAAIAGSRDPADLARERTLRAEIQTSSDEDRPLIALRDLHAASGATADAAAIEELRRSRFTPEHRLDWQFEDELLLLGIDGRPVGTREIEITLYWKAARQPTESYAVYTRWSRAECGEKQDQILGLPGHPTTHWVAGQTFKQRYRLAVPQASRGCLCPARRSVVTTDGFAAVHPPLAVVAAKSRSSPRFSRPCRARRRRPRHFTRRSTDRLKLGPR